MRRSYTVPTAVILLVTALLLMISATACGSASTPPAATQSPTSAPTPTAESPAETEPVSEATEAVEADLEEFDPSNFSNPTVIDNPWFPMKPGMQYIYEGNTEEAGLSIPHRVIITFTDMTKVIDGVRTLVAWDQDFSASSLVETELAFFAQDDDGNVWRLGEYPEVYEEGKLVEVPTWFTGLKGARAGIIIPADPQLGDPSFSQGWAPAVNFTDRGQVSQVGEKTCVPVDCYENVLVIEEFSLEEPDAFQLKYYAQDVGNVRVGWKGEDATQEELELVEIVELTPEAMEEVHTAALELEQRGYELSKEVYAETSPIELPSSDAESG